MLDGTTNKEETKNVDIDNGSHLWCNTNDRHAMLWHHGSCIANKRPLQIQHDASEVTPMFRQIFKNIQTGIVGAFTTIVLVILFVALCPVVLVVGLGISLLSFIGVDVSIPANELAVGQ